LRQAYDYWQNQPGNYPESAQALETKPLGTPPTKGAELAVTR
jgi:hypothetical protein